MIIVPAQAPPVVRTDLAADRELRAEVRALLTGPGSRAAWRVLADRDGPNGENDPRPLYRLLGRHRLLAPHWPRAYGGRGLPARATAIVVDEMIAAGVPEVLHTLSVQICGNFLLAAGTPEQRATMLPGMAAGTEYCTVLYTEPGVGSDLASLTTRAEPHPGGGWLITGRKVYSVRAWLADTGLVAARTHEGASRYQGVTLFLVPLTAPGVAVGSLPSMADEAFVDARLSGVRVDDDRVVGSAGEAWPLITAALALERTGVDFVAKAQAWLRAWYRGNAAGQAVPAPEHAAQAGRLWTRVQAGRALSDRCVARLEVGEVDPVSAAVTKLWTSEAAREVAWWCADTLHERGLAVAGDDRAVAGGRLEAAYREAPGLTIQAGTSEMMCELIAAAGLPGTGTDTDPLGAVASAAGDCDELVADLRRAVRWAVSSPRDQPRTAGPGADWELLASFGLIGLDLPAVAGGYEIGRSAALAAVTELGAAGYDGGILDTMTAAAALAAGPLPERGRAHLRQVLAGRRAAALVDLDRPLRPVADPGPGGLLLIMAPGGHALRLLAVGPQFTGPGVAASRLCAAGGERALFTITLGEAATQAAALACEGTDVRPIVAADLLRRAAWLLGAGTSCVTATVRRARTRRQFGKALIDNQDVSFRLARLSAHAYALRALISELGAVHDAGPDLAAAAGTLAEAGRFASVAAREAVQLHGAFGMVTGSPVEPLYRHIRIMIAQCPPPWTLDRLAGEQAGHRL